MLPPAPPLAPATADRWNAARVPPWVYRAALPLAWFAAFTTFMFLTGTKGVSCDPADPTLCGPDQSFAFWVIIAAATPLLLIMNRPVVGCLAGVAYAVADVGYDPTTGGRIAFVVHGALCLAVLVWVLRSRAMQASLIRDATGGFTASLPVAVDPGWNKFNVFCSFVFAISGLGLFFSYSQAISAEQVHVDRSSRATATVAARDEDELTVTVVDPAGRRHLLDVHRTETYAVGERVPVLLDPADPSWARLVAEPDDETLWETGGYGCILIALLVAGGEFTRRRRVQTLATGNHPALAVRVLPDDSHLFIYTAHDREGSANGHVAIVPLLAEVPGRPGETPFDAVLLGSFHDGGWVLPFTAEGALVPDWALVSLPASGPRISLTSIQAK